jgi:hypothetical protein
MGNPNPSCFERIMTMTRKILRVDFIELRVTKGEGGTLLIVAEGTVPISGWNDAYLVPYIYIQPPIDGIYDFDFVAEPPTGMAAEILLPIIASHTWHKYPADLKGVRVNASTNNKVAKLAAASQLKLKRS